jgi:hypothetical protein
MDIFGLSRKNFFTCLCIHETKLWVPTVVLSEAKIKPKTETIIYGILYFNLSGTSVINIITKLFSEIHHLYSGK